MFEGRYCGCSVAVKQMHETIVSPHNQSLFWREIDIASRCRHPCLLQFIGATNDEGIPLYVTELMETSLRQLLKQRPPSKTEICYCSECGWSFKLPSHKETFSDYPPWHQQWQCVAMATRKSMARESFWLRRCQIQGTEDVDWSWLFCLQRSRSK